MVDKCVQRYYHLLAQTKRNEVIVEVTRDDGSTNSGDPLRYSPKPQLIILDLDETLIDQRTKNRRIVSIHSRDQSDALHARLSVLDNVKDLSFGFRREQKPGGEEGVHLIVFRQFLMRLIQETMHSANFVVYSLAEPKMVIPRIILIEMYFK